MGFILVFCFVILELNSIHLILKCFSTKVWITNKLSLTECVGGHSFYWSSLVQCREAKNIYNKKSLISIANSRTFIYHKPNKHIHLTMKRNIFNCKCSIKSNAKSSSYIRIAMIVAVNCGSVVVVDDGGGSIVVDALQIMIWDRKSYIRFHC